MRLVLAALALVTACTRFGDGTPKTDAGIAPTDGGADAAVEGSVDAGPPLPPTALQGCNRPTTGFTSDFSIDEPAWVASAEDDVEGTITKVLEMPVGGFPSENAPKIPWWRARTSHSPGGEYGLAAVLERGLPVTRPTIVELAYDFVFARMDFLTEAGCRIELRDADAFEKAYGVYLESRNGSPGKIEGSDDRFNGSWSDGGKKLPLDATQGAWHRVVMRMDIDPTSGPRTAFQIDGVSASTTLDDPKLGFEVTSLHVLCGVDFSRNGGSNTVKADVGFDNVSVRVCTE